MSELSSRKALDFSQPESGPREIKFAAGRLDSWKEIAGHLRRGARTLQRWEREQGLPVHRLRHDQGSTIYAYKSELDAWMARQRTVVEMHPPANEETGLSIAVLPFTDISREKDQGYFCEGMAEEIINALSRIQGLRVASRSSAFQFKAAPAGSCEKLRAGIAEGDGNDVFGGGQLEYGGGEDLKQALDDDPTWMWRRQTAICRRTAFGAPGRGALWAGHPGRASDLWWLAVRTREKLAGSGR